MTEFFTQLVNGIPVYMWIFMAVVLFIHAGVLFLSIQDDKPRRRTTSARNPSRGARYGP